MADLEDNLKIQKLEKGVEKKHPGFLELLNREKLLLLLPTSPPQQQLTTAASTTTSQSSTLLLSVGGGGGNDSSGGVDTTATRSGRHRSTSNYSNASNISNLIASNKTIMQAYTKFMKEVSILLTQFFKTIYTFGLNLEIRVVSLSH